MPRIIPVLDVMGGQVVRAVGGRRDEYRPVVSKLTEATDPVTVAEALLTFTGADELYVADLDLIRWGIADPPAEELLTGLSCRVFHDAGGHGPETPLPTWREIYSLEAGLRPESNARHARTPGAVFSVDLMNGRLTDGWQDWKLRSDRAALGLVRAAFDLGYRAFVVLDMGRIGMGEGAGTESLLRAVREEYPAIELIAGGGIRNWDDIDRLGDAGADAVLVASALHDGTLTFPRPGFPERCPGLR